MRNMDTTKFKIGSNNECKSSKVVPDQKAIQRAVASAKKKYLETAL
jgi:hypothetical protein